jgi:hypothetical protein
MRGRPPFGVGSLWGSSSIWLHPRCKGDYTLYLRFSDRLSVGPLLHRDRQGLQGVNHVTRGLKHGLVDSYLLYGDRDVLFRRG